MNESLKGEIMHKSILTLILILFSCMGYAVEKINDNYCIIYGEPTAPVKVVEYFSLGCPKCLFLFTEEFDYLKQRYIDAKKVHWVFHPNPTDIQTLQAMICIEQLSPRKKQLFLEDLLPKLQGKSPESKTRGLKQVAYRFDVTFPSQDQIDSLKKTDAFKNAYQFVSQKEGIEAVPTVEVNGILYEEMPRACFLERKFWEILQEKKNP